MNRTTLIQETRELVTRVMNLRPPQAEALKEFAEALCRLPRRLSECTPDQRREFLSFRDGWSHPFHPNFTFELATGIGKTRLAGAIMALLWLTGEAQSFLILAPRRAVLRRFESALNPRFREYIFVDQNLVPEPTVITSDQVESPVATEVQDSLFASGPRIYLLTPQLVTSSERFRGRNEFTGKGLAEILREKADLVAIVDEAHHVGKLSETSTTAWTNALRDLRPALQLGLTATPRTESGVNILYRYPLSRALVEGHYTKDVQLLIRQFADAAIGEDDVDRATIRFALGRLALKEQALESLSGSSFPSVKPVLVLFARDQAHAVEVGRWLVEEEGLAKAEVLVTHSGMSKSEEEIERLLSIESTQNVVRVVVNVQELTEGWDVTNVYVVAPLRAMATFQGALQAMGRGLRLPAGRRVGSREVDTLDVVCFGKESLGRIIEQATSWSGQPPATGAGLRVNPFDTPPTTTVDISVPVSREEVLRFSSVAVEHVEPQLNFDSRALDRLTEMVVSGLRLMEAKSRVFGVGGQPSFDRDRFLDAAAMRVLRGSGQLLSDVVHFPQLRTLLEGWLNRIRPGAASVTFDPAEVGEVLARLVKEEARRHHAGYRSSGVEDVVTFPSFSATIEIASADGAAVPTLKIADMPAFDPHGEFRVRFPYAGSKADGTTTWMRGLHPAYCFDAKPEAMLACALDRSSEVVWWVRNEPRRMKLRTPAGGYSPDFVVCAEEHGTGEATLWLVEAKADLFWESPGSEPRLKADAATRWCAVQNELRSSKAPRWQFGVALEGDIRRASSWAELRPRLVT